MKITKSQLRQVIREAIKEVSGLDVYGDGQKDKPYVGLSPEETLAEVADDLEGIADQMVSAGEAEGKFAGLIQQVSDAILANLKQKSAGTDVSGMVGRPLSGEELDSLVGPDSDV